MPRRLILAVLTCLAALGIVACVVSYRVVTDSRAPNRTEKFIVEKLLRWDLPHDEYYQVHNRAARDPLPVLHLLAHDSLRVRRWAESTLTHCGGLNDEVLGLIATEMKNPTERGWGYDRPALVRILTRSGERGVGHIASLYRSLQPIEPVLQAEIYATMRETGNDLINPLLAVVKDDMVTLENRCRAAEALGCMRKPDETKGGATPEVAAIAQLTNLLPKLPEPVATAVHAALRKIDQDYPDRDEPLYVGDGRVLSPDADGGADAFAALKDKTDWLRVGRAAELVARHNLKQAIPELQQVASNHWYAPVRKTAEQAVRVLQGQEPPLPGGKVSSQRALVFEYEEQARGAGAADRKPHAPPSEAYHRNLGDNLKELLKPARTVVFRLLQPRIEKVEYRPFGRLPWPAEIDDFSMLPMYPEHAIRFAGGKLLGYNRGEFGGGTVFYRRGETPLFFGTSVVERFIRMPFGILVVGEVEYLGQGRICLATEDGNHQVSVSPFLRLPNGTYVYEVLSSGEVRFLSPFGDLYISRTGEIRMVE